MYKKFYAVTKAIELYTYSLLWEAMIVTTNDKVDSKSVKIKHTIKYENNEPFIFLFV